MKIAIIGHSGSGKSTLARKLSQQYNLPVLHFDTVQFLPDWEIRSEEEKKAMTKAPTVLVGAFFCLCGK